MPWEGITFWDLVQPGFMYIVGVAMPFALAIRAQQGATLSDNARHVAIRSLKLIALSQLLSMGGSAPYRFQMINVLCQIALTYFLVFWIMRLRFRWQAVIAVALLVFHTALFHLFPGPDGPYSQEGNIGQVIDKAVMGYNYPGLWVGINFITSTVTTLLGAWTGHAAHARPGPSPRHQDAGGGHGRGLGARARDQSLEPDRQADLHGVVHPLQRRLGAPRDARSSTWWSR